MTSAGNTGQWKKNSKDHLNSTHTDLIEEAEAEDPEVDSDSRGILWFLIQSWKENGVRGPQLKAVLEFKYLGVLFQIEGRMEQEIESQISAMAAVMRLYWSIVVQEPSEKVKSSSYRSIKVSPFTYCIVKKFGS